MENLIGKTFFRLTVIGFSHRGERSRPYWLCECSCGRRVVRQHYKLKGNASCGCWHKERSSKFYSELNKKHGNSPGHHSGNSPTYNTWLAMKGRCTYKGNASYDAYAKKGITVCAEWEHDFSKFLADMGERPSKDHSIDRIDNAKGYSKDNCRWATRDEQQANRKRTLKVIWNGVETPLTEVWRKSAVSVSYSCFANRVIKLGWSIDEAIHSPVNTKTKIKHI